MRSETTTLIDAMRILANEIGSEDGVANAAIAEAADRLDELQAEVERLREDNQLLRRQNGSLTQQVIDRGQERDQLKAQLFIYGCEDVDVIRCLKTLAYEHNHSDVPRYKDLAKRTMDKYVDRCTSAGSALADHDAEAIERVASELSVKARDEYHRIEYQSGYLAAVHDAFIAANQLRQQAKEVQS